MNSLKLGGVFTARTPVPGCDSCQRRRGVRTRDCLCQGTGAYYECDCCGAELIGGNDDTRCYTLTTFKTQLTICRACIGVATADELETVMVATPEPDFEADAAEGLMS